MNKSGLVTHLMVKHGMDKDSAAAVVDTLLETMRDALLSGDEVVLMNIGTLKPKPQTKTSRISFGKEIEIKKQVKISFRASKNLEVRPEKIKSTGNPIVDGLKSLK